MNLQIRCRLCCGSKFGCGYCCQPPPCTWCSSSALLLDTCRGNCSRNPYIACPSRGRETMFNQNRNKISFGINGVWRKFLENEDQLNSSISKNLNIVYEKRKFVFFLSFGKKWTFKISKILVRSWEKRQFLTLARPEQVEDKAKIFLWPIMWSGSNKVQRKLRPRIEWVNAFYLNKGTLFSILHTFTHWRNRVFSVVLA